MSSETDLTSLSSSILETAVHQEDNSTTLVEEKKKKRTLEDEQSVVTPLKEEVLLTSLISKLKLRDSDASNMQGHETSPGDVVDEEEEDTKGYNQQRKPSPRVLGFGEETTMIVYSSKCMLHRTGEHHQEHPDRLKVLCDQSTGGVLRSLKGLKWIENPEPAKLSDVLRVHDPMYVQHLQNSCTQKKHGHKFDADTVLSGKDSFDAALLAAGSLITAVDAVANGACKKVFCAIRPPGHHAGPRGAVTAPSFGTKPDMCSCGFCLFNNVAIGAAYARHVYGRTNRFEKGRRDTPVLRRVAIVDFDVHHGNGTEQILLEMKPHEYDLPLPPSWPPMRGKSCRCWLDEKDSEEVWFGSVHLYADNFYPLSGKESTKKNIVNVCLSPCGPADQRLRHRLSATKIQKCKEQASKEFRERISSQLIPRLREFRPDIVFISAGFDAHHNDFYHFLTTDDYRWITTELCNVANEFSEGRLISALEGGYQTKPREDLSKKKKKRRHGTRNRTKRDETKEEEHEHVVVLSPLAECVEVHVKAMMEGGSNLSS